jgi:hypothetical protein
VLARTARALIANEVGERATPDAVAAGAARACEKLCLHLARIVGGTGILALFDRSVAVSRSEFPWLPAASGASSAARWTELASALAGQPPAAALEAVAMVVTTLVELLGRLIGDDLTLRLLQELRPDGRSPGTRKETT